MVWAPAVVTAAPTTKPPAIKARRLMSNTWDLMGAPAVCVSVESMAATAGSEGGVILHLSEQLLHVGKPQRFLPRPLKFLESMKLTHCDGVALMAVLLGEERLHVLDEGAGDIGR